MLLQAWDLEDQEGRPAEIPEDLEVRPSEEVEELRRPLEELEAFPEGKKKGRKGSSKVPEIRRPEAPGRSRRSNDR